jgi:UDP-N-acetyl-D-glucosamine dehydrogenase
MPEFVVEKIQNALNDASKSVRGSNVHILGIAYKRNIDDVRESPALDIMMLLERLGAKVTYSDPFVPSVTLNASVLKSQEMLPFVGAADCVVIVTDHTGLDYAKIVEQSKIIVDTRNALKGFRSPKIVRL